MDQTNGPLSGMDPVSFHADSTSIFSPTSIGGTLPPLPNFQESGSHDSASHQSAPPAIAGQSSLLGRGTGNHSNESLDSVTSRTADTQSIEFRVARADSPVRRLRLTGNRYTFGSAEGCSIRLNEPSLRPMHAVLTRDGDRVVVRAYSVPVEVNQNRVTEATLVVGDQLRLGEYEFELLTISESPATAASPNFAAANSFEPGGRGNASATSNQAGLQTDADETVWRQRLRKEIDQWRAKQVECDRRASQCDEREAHLRGRESELWSRAENLYRREAKIQDQESAVYQMHDDYADRQQELLRLREETNAKQRHFQQRESEFAQQEAEYRQQLEEATAHLLQSQAQATAATEAVKEMRLQFEALNEQIEELSDQQTSLKRNEETEREENQRQRSDLENQRDAAIDAQAESEARRREALDRVEQMSAELESLRSQQAEAGATESQQLLENETTINSLREQVEGLQELVDEASEEANRLRSDYRDALDSVRQLEELVAQSNRRGDTDRAQWASDADSLRSEIESLSTDLEKTREELDHLREANQSLNTRLHEVETERDQAVQEISDRPTREAFDHLRSELESANQTLADLRQGIAQDDAEDDSANQIPEGVVSDKSAEESNLSILSLPEAEATDDVPASEWGSEVLPAEDSPAEAVVDQDAVAENNLADNQITDQVSPSIDETPEDVWPTYQMTEAHDADRDRMSEPEQAPEEVQSEGSLSIWNLESTAIQAVPDHGDPDHGDADPVAIDDGEELIENTGVWNPDSASDLFSETDSGQPENAFESASSIWDASASDEDAETFSDDSSGEEQQSEASSFASQLIADLDVDEDPNQIPESNQVDQVKAEQCNPFHSSIGQDEDRITEHAVVDSTDAGDCDEEASLGLMALFADDSAAGDASEKASDSSSENVAARDRGYAEESGSDLISDSASDSVWNIEASDENNQRESDRFSETYSQYQDNTEPPQPSESEPTASQTSQHESNSSDGRVDVTAMMSGMEELEEEEPVEADSFSGYQQQSEEIEEESSSAMVQESSPEPVDDAVPTPDASATEEEIDDDSIEAYMNRLLGRVQGTPGTEESSPVESVSLSSVSVNMDESTDVDTESNSSPMAPQAEIDPDAPLVPRSQAPERNSDLSAMRDLANQSARTAISRSARIQTRNMQMAGVMNFGVALVAVLFGFGASLMLTGGLLYLAWLMVVIIAAISIRDGLRNLADARARMEAAQRGELPQALQETLADPGDQVAKMEDDLAL